MARICLKIVSLQYFVSLLQDLITNLAKATWRRSIGSKWWGGWRWLAPDIAWWFFIISMLLGLTGGLGSNGAVLPHDVGWVWDCLWCRVCWRSKTLNDSIRKKNLLLSKFHETIEDQYFPLSTRGVFYRIRFCYISFHKNIGVQLWTNFRKTTFQAST